MKGRITIIITAALLVMAAGAVEAKCPRRTARQAVEKMAQVLFQRGAAGLKVVRRFRFCQNNYVWVFTPRAKLLANPTLPRLEGTNVFNLKDDRGKQFYIYFLKAGRSAHKKVEGQVYYVGSGWVGYRWRRIGQRTFTDKCSFIKGVIMGRRNVFLGAGVYAKCPPGAL